MSDLDVMILPLNDDSARRVAFSVALSMYASEPCRICRRMLTMEDLRDGAKFAGYSVDGTARVAHRVCWDNFVELLQTTSPDRLHELTTKGVEGTEG